MLKRFCFLFLCVLTLACGRDVEDTAKKDGKSAPHKPEPISQTHDDSLTSEDKKDLLIAIDSDSLSLLNTQLSNKPFVDFIFENGETPITYAMKNSNSYIIKALIKHSKNIDLINENGESPLGLAIYANDKNTLKEILTKKANVNLVDSFNRTPLELAIDLDKPQIAILLVKNGSQLPDEVHFSSLSSRDNFREVLQLINDIKKHDEVTEKTLNTTITAGNYHFLEYLLSTFDKYKEILKQRNYLISAIKLKDNYIRSKTLDILLAFGADPNSTEGVHPLIIATEEDLNYSLISQLLKAGSSPLIEDDFSNTPLDYAVMALDMPVVRLIVMTMKSLRNDENTNQIDLIFSNSCQSLEDRREQRTTQDERIIYQRIKYFLNC